MLHYKLISTAYQLALQMGFEQKYVSGKKKHISVQIPSEEPVGLLKSIYNGAYQLIFLLLIYIYIYYWIWNLIIHKC